MKVIHDLAAAAVGFNTERGDQLIVESLPFESTLNAEPPVLPTPTTPKKLTFLDKFNADPRMLTGVAAAIIVLFCGGFAFFYTKSRAPRAAPVQVQTQPALPQASEESGSAEALRPARGETDKWTPSIAGAAAMPALAAGRAEVLTNQLRATAQKDTEICAGVLRGWLKEERA
jgi:flagellar M-ring protein FliF